MLEKNYTDKAVSQLGGVEKRRKKPLLKLIIIENAQRFVVCISLLLFNFFFFRALDLGGL